MKAHRSFEKERCHEFSIRNRYLQEVDRNYLFTGLWILTNNRIRIFSVKFSRTHQIVLAIREAPNATFSN